MPRCAKHDNRSLVYIHNEEHSHYAVSFCPLCLRSWVDTLLAIEQDWYTKGYIESTFHDVFETVREAIKESEK